MPLGFPTQPDRRNGVSLDVSALGSIATSLDELVRRLHEVGGELSEDDEVGAELREVERQLIMASRRLEKAARRASS